ncbi:MAG: Obg family GTPase CgtA, partial [Ruoffia tabacinasalis]
LVPNLGVVQLANQQEFVVADMPGLIEGASEGVGLGIQFLRHIERTKIMLHVIDMGAVHGRDPFVDFTDIMDELEAYNERLLLRPMLIVANKMDEAISEENLEIFEEKLNAYYGERELEVPEIFPISSWQNKGVDQLIKKTASLVQNEEFIPLEEEVEIEEAYYTLEQEEAPFEVEQVEEGFYRITGAQIEKLFAMTNMAHDESIARFQRQMRGMGIDQALRDIGAQTGDIVELSTFQFEFMD